jgi:short-chain fatty acids transporter
MLEQIGQRFERLVRQYMPDPFLLALIFSLVTVALAALWTGADFLKIVDTWFYGATKDDGFWALLKFAMQMVLIVVTGEAVAASPIVHRAIKRLAGTPRSAWGAVVFVSMLSMFLGWLHWGFGLISAALLSREVAAQAKARGIKIHYPLLGAAGYTALLIWHGGLSASAPLNANSSSHFAFTLIGRVVPMEETIFNPMNYVACGVLLLTVPFLLAAMTPKSGEEEISTETLAEMKPVEFVPDRSTIAGRIDASPVTSWLIVIMGATFLFMYFHKNGWTNLNHDIVNFSFLMIGMALHRSPMAYAKAISQSLRGTAGIVLQFPFYGGIMGIMNGTGLGEKIAHLFIGFATPQTLPFFTYLCSVFSKLFVPSGGGEWAIEGPVMLKAAIGLKASIGKTIMAICYGNMVGNMFQPFWALPLLGIMGLSARQIMGYCLVVFCFAFPILGIMLLVFS